MTDRQKGEAGRMIRSVQWLPFVLMVTVPRCLLVVFSLCLTAVDYLLRGRDEAGRKERGRSGRCGLELLRDHSRMVANVK